MYNNCLKGKQFDYPIYIDVEDDTGGRRWLRNAGKEAITDGIIGFCEALENLGYYVGIYANLDWFNNWINQSRVVDYDKWLAAWLKNKPSNEFSNRMWQFGGETNQQRSPYLAGQIVDQDYCYYDYPGVIIGGGFNGYPKNGEVKPQPQPVPQKKSNEELANEVLEGKWGNGEERKKRLTDAGYNYQEVQNLVNKKLGIGTQPQYYIIKRGDTLTKIAQMFGTTVNELVRLNGIADPNLIFAGNQLRVK